MCTSGVLMQIWMGTLVFLLIRITILSAVDNVGAMPVEEVDNHTAEVRNKGDIGGEFASSSTLTATISSTTLSAVGTERTSAITTGINRTTSATTPTAITARSTTFPSLEGDVYEEEDAERERLHNTGGAGDVGDHGGGGGGEGDGNTFSDRTLFEEKPYNKPSLFDRIKAIFKPTVRNNVLAHAVEGGMQFREKYGSSNVATKQAPYGEDGVGGYYSGPPYSNNYRGEMIPDGAFAPVYKPPVTLTLTADFIELNCATHGRIQHGIRWVKLVGLNPYGHHLFATVADGDRILFDNYHFGVRTDGKNSRLMIRNPDSKVHYGVYQCQASVAGNPSVIVKEDFVVGRVK